MIARSLYDAFGALKARALAHAWLESPRPQRLGAIAEMHRLLRPGGQAVIRDMRGDASDAALDAKVRAMGFGRLATILNRFIFRQLRRRAYKSDELLRMVATTPFGGTELRENDLGFDIVMPKPPQSAAHLDSPTP